MRTQPRDSENRLARIALDNIFNPRALAISVEMARQGGKNELSGATGDVPARLWHAAHRRHSRRRAANELGVEDPEEELRLCEEEQGPGET